MREQGGKFMVPGRRKFLYLAAATAAETEKWAKVIKFAGLKVVRRLTVPSTCIDS